MLALPLVVSGACDDADCPTILILDNLRIEIARVGWDSGEYVFELSYPRDHLRCALRVAPDATTFSSDRCLDESATDGGFTPLVLPSSDATIIDGHIVAFKIADHPDELQLEITHDGQELLSRALRPTYHTFGDDDCGYNYTGHEKISIP
jgi:hypothetical protein